MTARRTWVIAASVTAGLLAASCSSTHARDEVSIQVDVARRGVVVSPLVRGVSGGMTVDELADAGIRLVSWGGNPSTRYNYEVGHAWNAGADWQFRNGNYGLAEGDAFVRFADANAAAGAATRLAVPTLGWIAKDDDSRSCSFPDGRGGCEPAGDGKDCESREKIADPQATSVASTPALVAGWVERLVDGGMDVRFIAMDNEPELWGYTHYDVHPTCTTFEEVLERYLTYAQAIRDVAPEAELLGPVTCCWFEYWDPDAEAVDGSGLDFPTWFLRSVRTADEQLGLRTLDVFDVHYYPQSDVYNNESDAATNARRLRSTRSLWDPDYTDESWIDTPIEFIPRLQSIVDEAYPGTRLAVSEWNFGADETVNGALAIADVIGILGRQGVYLAAYWFAPPVDSPGYQAFKMHGNYDGEGSSFDGLSVAAETSDVDVVSSFAVLDEETGMLRLMLVNKNPDETVRADVGVDGFSPMATVRRFTYGAADPTAIHADAVRWTGELRLPAYSITVLELMPRA